MPGNAGEAGAGRYRCRDNMMREKGKTERENRVLYIQNSIPPNITISNIWITNFSQSGSKLLALSSRMTRVYMYKGVLEVDFQSRAW